MLLLEVVELSDRGQCEMEQQKPCWLSLLLLSHHHSLISFSLEAGLMSDVIPDDVPFEVVAMGSFC